MKVLIEHGQTHYFNDYEKNEEIHCPNCGNQSVYVEQGPGDYYEGPKHICIDCSTIFSLPTFAVGFGGVDAVVRQLRSGVMDIPTTTKGH